jgi:hypothetical protein
LCWCFTYYSIKAATTKALPLRNCKLLMWCGEMSRYICMHTSSLNMLCYRFHSNIPEQINFHARARINDAHYLAVIYRRKWKYAFTHTKWIRFKEDPLHCAAINNDNCWISRRWENCNRYFLDTVD